MTNNNYENAMIEKSFTLPDMVDGDFTSEELAEVKATASASLLTLTRNFY